MYRMRSWRMPLAALVVAAAILLAGGLAVASNMGFKMNKPLVAGGAGQIGNNWTSIPYNNPYGTVGGLCSGLGLPSATSTNSATVQMLNNDGTFAPPEVCFTVGAGGSALVAGKGVQIHMPPFVAGNPTSVIIVGSHNPTKTIVLPSTGTGPLGNFWFAVPYHTTAVTLNDVCVQAGMSGGVAEQLNAATGAFTTRSCPSADAATINLVLGQSIRLRQPPSGLTFTPAHF
jgi:hypothetical protein